MHHQLGIEIAHFNSFCIWCLSSAVNLTLLAIGTAYVFRADQREPEPVEDADLIEDEVS